ncbi:MAG: GNAT family N-acetyltransferase [Paludibacter sp.]|nr:GNAT family N-acetyltransferase [Paludibacter sp.]
MDIDINKINIRNVDLEDISLMVQYRIDYLAEMQGKRDDAFIKQLKIDMNDFIKKGILNGNFFALVAEYDGIAVGYGAIVLREIPGDFNRSTYLEGDILNMYTIPAARRKGISTLILKQLLLEAKTMGITKLALHTSKDGEKLYRSNGFSEPLFPYFEMPLA